jgi:hypothetical protein
MLPCALSVHPFWKENVINMLKKIALQQIGDARFIRLPVLNSFITP